MCLGGRMTRSASHDSLKSHEERACEKSRLSGSLGRDTGRRFWRVRATLARLRGGPKLEVNFSGALPSCRMEETLEESARAATTKIQLQLTTCLMTRARALGHPGCCGGQSSRVSRRAFHGNTYSPIHETTRSSMGATNLLAGRARPQILNILSTYAEVTEVRRATLEINGRETVDFRSCSRRQQLPDTGARVGEKVPCVGRGAFQSGV
eukprot:923620-Rhodomonas_salina.5